jgi:hypothetical protein
MAKDRASHPGRKPNLDDVRSAWFSGKVTAEEANDLSDTKGFGEPDKASDFSLDHGAYHTHKRAGLK